MSTELTVIQRAAKALGSAENEAVLAEMVKNSAAIIEIKNADGRTQCHSAYMTLKNRRTAIRGVGKEARDDATKFSKAVIAEEDRLVAIIEPEEIRLRCLRDKWDADREAERVAKEQAEANRIAAIRDRINDLRTTPVDLMNSAPDRLENAIADIEEFVVTAEVFEEFADAARAAQVEVVAKLKEMHAAAVQKVEHEAQLAREREELVRLRAEQEERERQAAAARAEEERRAREIREQEEADRREAQRRADEAMRAEREAHEAKMAAERAEIARQQAEIAAERSRQEEEAEAKRQAEEAAARAEADRIRAEQEAKVAEENRRRRYEFLLGGPAPSEMIGVIAKHYGVDDVTALNWLNINDWALVELTA
jgi:hypothetical protein